MNDIFVKAYQQLLLEAKRNFKIVLKDKPKKVLGNFNNGAEAYNFARNYTKSNIGKAINIVEILPDGSENVLDTFIGVIDRNQNPHMSTYDAYLRRTANREKYEELIAANEEKRKAKTELRTQIASIMSNAKAEVEQLKQQIVSVKRNAFMAINNLKAEFKTKFGITPDEEPTAQPENQPIDLQETTEIAQPEEIPTEEIPSEIPEENL